jgi:hypothetical protein
LAETDELPMARATDSPTYAKRASGKQARLAQYPWHWFGGWVHIYNNVVVEPAQLAGVHPGENAFSWRDLILIGGGLFLVQKGTVEIHAGIEEEGKPGPGMQIQSQLTIAQIAAMDLCSRSTA